MNKCSLCIEFLGLRYPLYRTRVSVILFELRVWMACQNLATTAVCFQANPSAKFQYTITKSDTSSKDFYNYGWNGASQCIVSFHDFISESLHSITMNVIGRGD